MSSHKTENAQQEHKQMKCPKCGEYTANLPNHINSGNCNP